MKLTLVCEHGTRTVEIEEGREGVGNVRSIMGKRSFAQQFVAEVMPRCPYCELQHAPRVILKRASLPEDDESENTRSCSWCGHSDGGVDHTSCRIALAWEATSD